MNDDTPAYPRWDFSSLEQVGQASNALPLAVSLGRSISAVVSSIERQECDEVVELARAAEGHAEVRVARGGVELPARVGEQLLQRRRLTVVQVRCAEREAVQRRTL